MASRSQKIRAGLFLVFALALLLATVAFLKHWYREESRQVVVVFPDDVSVAGLVGGSRVKFKGVPVGRVRDVDLEAAPAEDGTAASFVVARIDVEADRAHFLSSRTRGFLVLEGITGASSIDLTDVPRQGEVFEADPESDRLWGSGGDLRIAGVPSNITRIIDSTPAVMTELEGLLKRTNRFIDEHGAQGATLITSLDRLVVDARPRLVAALDRADSVLRRADSRLLADGGFLDRISGSIDRFGGSFDRSVGGFSSRVSTVARDVGDDVSKTLESVQATVDPARGTLIAVESTLSEFRELLTELKGVLRGNRAEFDATVGEVRDAAESLDALLLELKNHPAGAVWGKPRPDAAEDHP